MTEPERAARERRILAVFEAALDQPENERAIWLSAVHGDDPDLVAKVEALIDVDREATRILPTEPLPQADIPAPELVGPYRIVALLGSGGMGDVYLGERADGLFEHKVAIKLMRPSALGEAGSAFFDTERRALARLRHRHIARLYDGGVTEAGAPFFVMEVVDGAPIDAHVRRGAPDLRAVARFVADICDAVQHAHQNLVVHADIKPSNILVDAEGEAKLLDFGIAQLAQGAAPESASMTYFPRTPGYASPQRLAGAWPRPADDIYSLGALLEELIAETGRPADADLAAIGAMAQANDAARRYPTAAAMADDLRRWLDVRPVAARSAGWRHIAACFARRNRWPVAIAMLAALILIGSLIVITVLYISAERSRAEAERNRAEAEQRFTDVRGLARYMLGDFHDSLETLAGAAPLRARTADVGRAYLERLSGAREGSPALKQELAIGYGRVGHALALRTTNASGDAQAGERLLEHAEWVLRAEVSREPADDALRVELAKVVAWRAGVRMTTGGDPAGAQRLFDEAFALFDAVLARHPTDPAAGYWRWNALIGQTDLLEDRAEWSRIIALLDRNRARIARLPTPPEYAGMRALLEAAGENAMGDAVYYTRGGVAAVPHYRQALAILETADARLRPDVRRQIREVVYHFQLVGTYQDLEDRTEALRWADRGTVVADALLRFDDSPTTQQSTSALALARARLLSEMGRHGEAIAVARADVARRLARVRQDPGYVDVQRSYGVALRPYMQILDAASRPAEACAVARSAAHLWAVLAAHGELPERIRTGEIAVIDRRLARCPAG